jgi:hypothetical protein
MWARPAAEAYMSPFVRTALLLCATGCAAPVQAESLRCNGYTAAEGDSRLSVLRKCGEPVLRDNFCAPLYLGPTSQPVPDPWASFFVPCQQVEAWLYDRGPGNLTATVRFRSGVVQSIRYGQVPQ